MAALRRACPVCARAADEPFAFLPDVPVHVNVLHATAEEALAAPRGDIALAYCSGCGAIWNVLFDPAVMTYDAEYENSLHFSQEFSRFSDELVDRLIQRHDLRDRHVAELGSGKGEFLTELCDRASCTGIGIDPAYAGESDARANGRVSFVWTPLREDTDLGGGKRWVVVAPEEGTGLLLARADGAGQAARVGDQSGGRVFLFLQTDDFAADHARMSAAGVRFIEAPRREPYGTVAVFEDLYGNRWDLIEPAP